MPSANAVLKKEMQESLAVVSTIANIEIVRYSRNWSVSNLEGAEPQIWENLYI